MVSFNLIKPKIKNLGRYKTFAEIKQNGLRVCYNRADDSYWLIENEFLRPVIKSPRECKSIIVDPKSLKYKIFMCGKSRKELRGSRALRYIEWGEERGFDKRPSCKGRKRWWNFGEIHKADFIMLRFRDKRNWTPLISEKIAIGDTVFIGSFNSGVDKVSGGLALNSTFQILITEVFGRINLGDGLLTTYGPEITEFLILHPSFVNAKLFHVTSFYQRKILSIFQECGIDPNSKIPIENQEPKPLPDRAALDKIIFDALSLTESECKEVYRAVCRLVWNRISKARSV